MPVDHNTLEQAAAALNSKSPSAMFQIDSKTNSLKTNRAFPHSSTNSMVLDHLDHIDEAIRSLPEESNFSIRNYVEFVPAYPGTTLEQYKDHMLARIKNDKALKLLAYLGRLEMSRTNFMKMSCEFFPNNVATPPCLTRITLSSLMNSGIDKHFERVPSIYLERSPENESLIEQQSFFDAIGLKISVFKYRQKRFRNEVEYYRISCADAELFNKKCARQNESLAKKSASALATDKKLDVNKELPHLLSMTEQLKKELATLRPLTQRVTDLEKQNSDLSQRLDNLAAENSALKEKYALLSTVIPLVQAGNTKVKPKPIVPVYRGSPLGAPAPATTDTATSTYPQQKNTR